MDDSTTGVSPAPESSGSTPVSSTPDTSAQQSEPSVYELDENALIKPRGYDKPVKFGEYSRGFQAQMTRASQRAAAAERELAEREARIQRFEREKQEAEFRSRQGQANDVLTQLSQLPYLDGQTAAHVVQGIAQEIRNRDQVLLATLKEMQKLRDTVSRLNESSTSSAFDAKISKWLTDGGYPQEAADLAKEIYLAYEGDDLDLEFPRIFQERWAQLKRLLQVQNEAAARAARGPSFVPGRGGQARPSRPLSLDPNSSAKDLADKLFPMLGSNEPDM